MLVRCISCLLAGAVLTALTPKQADADPPATKQAPRRYDQGPLRIDEFRRNAPESIPGKALTMTRVMFNYEFQMKRDGQDQFEAKLTSLNTFAVFLPDESWWNHGESEALLDHEQGHFDIAEITSRRLQLAFNRMFKSNQSISAKARTATLAKTAIAEKLNKVMSVANEQTLRDNEEYDNRTYHGLRENAQREYRRIQLLTLSKLQENLNGGRVKRNARTSNFRPKQK